jgi:type IV pilus assembly protein PilC
MKKQTLDAEYLSSFAQELALTLHDGIAPADALSLLRAEEPDPNAKELLLALHDAADKGDYLYSAMEKNGSFPDYFVHMVRLGETTGRLEDALGALSRYYERQESMRRSIRSAVAYPSLLLVMMLIVVVILITKVLPIFSDVFNQFGASVPAGVARLMAAGRALSGASGAIIAVIVALAALLFILSRVPSFREGLYRRFLGGRSGALLLSARFVSALSMGVSSGLDMDDALALSDMLCASPEMSKKIAAAKTMMSGGTSFAESLRSTGILPPRDSRTLAIAVRTGTTDTVLQKIADRQENAAEERIDRAVAVIEPAFVIILSVVVGLILLSVMLPLISIMTCIG